MVALGGFPETEAELVKLPGIGPYTAGAIAAIAFDQRAAAVDGNVDRVFARLLALKGEWQAEKKVIAAAVRALVPAERPGEFAEALMDLGATICTPTRPNCLLCPLSDLCAAYAEGLPERYPIKPAKDWPKTGIPDAAAPAEADWQAVGDVRHVFTHFTLTLSVKRAALNGKRPDGVWTPIRDVEGLPTVFAKAFRLATADA